MVFRDIEPSHWRSISLIFAFSKENKFYKAKISKWWVISLSTSEESRVTMLVYEVVVMYMSCHDVHVLSTCFLENIST